MTLHAQEFGADASLQVLPYYNKPSQEGMYRHFKKIASSTKLPIIIYNIKGRCGVNLETQTLLRLINECPNIVGVKEASGDMNQIREVIANAPPYFSVFSGDDSLALDVIKAGGDGVIATTSNLVPKEYSRMVHAALQGNFAEAEEINSKLLPLFKAAFIESNPMCIKYMASVKGMCKPIWRLPICEPLFVTQEKIKEEMKKFGLI